MRFPLFISKKYLKSKHASNYLSFVSVISVSGIALGVAVLIIALTVLHGFENAIAEKIVNFNSHIKITAFGKRNLSQSDDTIEIIKKTAGNSLVNISPFLTKEAIIKSKRFSEGITITGISSAGDNSGISQYIVDGVFDFNGRNGSKGILLGKKLADKLFIKTGDKITLFTLYKDSIPTAENPPAIDQFYVAGIYVSGMAEYDDLNVYLDLKDAQKLCGLESSISGYNLKLNNISVIESLSEKLQKALRYPHFVRSIYRVHQNIFTWLDLQKEPIPIVLGLIIMVAVFNIIGTLLLMVLERTKSIGILKTLGADKKQITGIFLIQGIVLSIIGIASGCLLSFVLSILQVEFNIFPLPSTVYFLDQVPITINPIHYLIVAASAFILSIIASLIPSYYAFKVDPAAAIRFE